MRRWYKVNKYILYHYLLLRNILLSERKLHCIATFSFLFNLCMKTKLVFAQLDFVVCWDALHTLDFIVYWATTYKLEKTACKNGCQWNQYLEKIVIKTNNTNKEYLNAYRNKPSAYRNHAESLTLDQKVHHVFHSFWPIRLTRPFIWNHSSGGLGS